MVTVLQVYVSPALWNLRVLVKFYRYGCVRPHSWNKPQVYWACRFWTGKQAVTISDFHIISDTFL